MTRNIYAINLVLSEKFLSNSLCLAIIASQASLVTKCWHPGLGKRDPEKLLCFWSLSSFSLAFPPALAIQPFSVPVYVTPARTNSLPQHSRSADVRQLLCLSAFELDKFSSDPSHHHQRPSGACFRCVLLLVGVQ